MPRALRVPGLVGQLTLMAQTVARHRALARWYPLRVESRIVLRPESWLRRQTVLLEWSAVVPGSPPEPVVWREQSVVVLARSRLPPAWLLASPAHPLLQAAWHFLALQERSVAPQRAKELQRACSQPGSVWKHLPGSVWKHLPVPVYCCRGQE